jgi:hypothetical protein
MTEPSPNPYPMPTPEEVVEILALRDWFMRRYPTLEARFAYVRKRRKEWLTNGREPPAGENR